MLNSYPTPTQVFDVLGDKVLLGLSWAIAGAHADLATYRATFPGWVSDASTSGLAQWIHGRMWAYAKETLDDIPGVTIVDSDPTHDILVTVDKATHRIRLKKHSLTGAIRAYPTESVLDFISQEPNLLTDLGYTHLNLTAGYDWDADLRMMGVAVISLRDGSFDKPIWTAELPAAAVAAGTTPIVPITPVSTDGPSMPIIDVSSIDEAGRTAEDDTP